jgi:histidinol-phosphate aminotransferase
MFDIKASLKDLKPYQPNAAKCSIKLDANESKNYLFKDGININQIPLNLYPDTASKLLREAISSYINVPSNQIIAGNGSSEMIELILKSFVEKNDVILSFKPTFVMYQIYSQIYDAKFISVPTYDDFQMNPDIMIAHANLYQPKIIFLCSPNNPTGLTIKKSDVKRIIKETSALIVMDEAYMEFMTDEDSCLDLIDSFDNLIILRTMSKAFGMAGLRLGYMASNTDLIEKMYRVKSPYNLNMLTQHLGTLALSDITLVKTYTNQIKHQRTWLYQNLKNLGIMTYPSEANFIFFKSDIEGLFDLLVDKDILIRPFKGELLGYYRVTVGEPSENQSFIEAMKEIIYENRENQ